MALLELLLIVVATHVDMTPGVFGQDEVLPGVNASAICDPVECPAGQFCRIFRQCQGTQCQASATCVSCVREGADDECNLRGFLYSLLDGNSSDPRSMMPVDCNNGTSCPFGSTCARHPHFIHLGECCFTQLSNDSVQNDNKKCLLCFPECQDGYVCQKVTRWGMEINECSPPPKAGQCPATKRKFCFFNRGPQTCQYDSDCPDIQKCCQTPSRGFSCMYPAKTGKKELLSRHV